MPLRESGRPLGPEFEGYTKVQVAIDSVAAASVMPERLLAGHTVMPGELPGGGRRPDPQPWGGR
eukprot:5087912-Alexandrium_andersonii.AAC.1